MIVLKILCAILGCGFFAWGAILLWEIPKVERQRREGTYVPLLPPSRLHVDPRTEGSIGAPMAAIMFIAFGVLTLWCAWNV